MSYLQRAIVDPDYRPPGWATRRPRSPPINGRWSVLNMDENGVAVPGCPQLPSPSLLIDRTGDGKSKGWLTGLPYRSVAER